MGVKRRRAFCSRIGTTLLLLVVAAALPLAGSAATRRVEFLQKETARRDAPAGGLLYFVNTTSDSVVPNACANGNPGCSLRGAIQAANSHVGDDGIEINLPPGSVINLTEALPDLNEGVSISGLGANQVTVRRDTGGNYRIFNVFATGTVALTGMTISNGLSSNGGAIANGSGTLNVTNCVLSGNSVSSPGDGGGISNYSTGTVNVANCTLSSNSAARGGGISNSNTGTVNVSNSRFDCWNSAARGGGISNSNTGTVNVSNSRFDQNFAPASGADNAFGGGIFNSGTLNVTNSFLSSNKAFALDAATSFQIAGGGIYNSSGVVTVTNSTLAYNGAGPYNSGTSSMNASGGGIFNDTGTVNVTNCTITDNSAFADGASRSARGGGIFNETGTLNITNSTISRNDSINGSVATRFGGGIFNAAGTVKVKSTIIALNAVFPGGSNPDASGPFDSQGFNLIGIGDGSTGFTQSTDQKGTVASPLDPRLDRDLQFNGGPTPTIALLFGSPAIDKGTGEVQPGLFLITDQRGTGFARTFDDPATANAIGGDGADIGAFEVQTTAPTVLGNISTRLRVETGDNVLIGGFIITGSQSEKVIVRAIGPSLPVAGALADPTLELRNSSGALIASNDNWRSSQEAEIVATGIPPSHDSESAIVAILQASGSAYTAIVRGVNNGTGIGVVEAYDLNQTVDSKLANIATRGLVQTGDDVLIAGSIVLGSASQRVLVRAIGPSLPVPGKLENPTLELRDANGVVIRANDNWRSDQEAEIIATTIPPTDDFESAIIETLPGNGAAYTAIVRGVTSTTGVAVVEVYALN